MTKPRSPAERVARRRAKPGFAEQCRRQSQLIRDSETDETRAEEEAWERGSAEALSDDPP